MRPTCSGSLKNTEGLDQTQERFHSCCLRCQFHDDAVFTHIDYLSTKLFCQDRDRVHVLMFEAKGL